MSDIVLCCPTVGVLRAVQFFTETLACSFIFQWTTAEIGGFSKADHESFNSP